MDPLKLNTGLGRIAFEPTDKTVRVTLTKLGGTVTKSAEFKRTDIESIHNELMWHGVCKLRSTTGTALTLRLVGTLGDARKAIEIELDTDKLSLTAGQSKKLDKSLRGDKWAV